MDNMEYKTLEECLDEHFGPIGTPERDAFEVFSERSCTALPPRRDNKVYVAIRYSYP